jgi:hypothetical protein
LSERYSMFRNEFLFQSVWQSCASTSRSSLSTGVRLSEASWRDLLYANKYAASTLSSETETIPPAPTPLAIAPAADFVDEVGWFAERLMNAEPHAELTVEMALLTSVLLSVPEVEFDAEERVERRRDEHLEQVGVDVEGRLRRVLARLRRV